MKLSHTPWGPPQCQKEIAPGIISVSTASHGGYWLAPERLTEVHPLLQGLNHYGGGQWFEEDGEWALVAVSFAHHFSPYDLAWARVTLWGYYPAAYVALYAADRPACLTCAGSGIAPARDRLGSLRCCAGCVPEPPQPALP